jgi:hypothetical protein
VDSHENWYWGCELHNLKQSGKLKAAAVGATQLSLIAVFPTRWIKIL